MIKIWVNSEAGCRSDICTPHEPWKMQTKIREKEKKKGKKNGRRMKNKFELNSIFLHYYLIWYFLQIENEEFGNVQVFK